MPTNTQIIDAVAQAVGDQAFTVRSKDTFISILNDALEWVIGETECLIKINTTGITLVANTQEYNVPSDFIKFPTDESYDRAGLVMLGTNARFLLDPTTTQRLDLEETYWRNTSAGTPTKFYLDLEGQAQIGLHPKPSQTFIDNNGSAVFMKYVFRPADIADNSIRPFDDNRRLTRLEFLLKLKAISQINLEDKHFSDFDRLNREVEKELERAKDFVNTILAQYGPISFDSRWRTTG